jgi:hypothetical protein
MPKKAPPPTTGHGAPPNHGTEAQRTESTTQPRSSKLQTALASAQTVLRKAAAEQRLKQRAEMEAKERQLVG